MTTKTQTAKQKKNAEANPEVVNAVLSDILFAEVEATEQEVAQALDEIQELAPVTTTTTPEATEVAKEKKSRRTAPAYEPKDKLALDLFKAKFGEQVYDLFMGDIATQPTKIAEKIYNAMCFVVGRANLSVYTAIAYNAIKPDNITGPLTAKELRDMYISLGYSEGTASSQAQQVWNLLQIVCVATTDEATKGLVFVDDNIMAEAFDEAAVARPPVTSKRTKEVKEVAAEPEVETAE